MFIDQVNTNATGQVLVEDVINTSMVLSTFSLNTTTPVEAKAGASRLVNRKVLILYVTGGTLYWGPTSSVSASAGIPITANSQISLNVTDNVPIYVMRTAGNVSVTVIEGS